MSDLFIETQPQYFVGSSDNHDFKQQQEDEEEDALANILSLKLRKPRHWKWELSTARSCANIALPRIILYDHEGRLLVDTDGNQQEQIIREPNAKASKKRSKTPSRHYVKAATSNLASSLRQVLEEEFDDLCIAEDYIDHTPSTLRSPVQSLTQSSADFYTHDLSDYKYKSPSSSGKEVRFKVNHKKPHDMATTNSSCSINMAGLPTPPSTSTPSTTNTLNSTSTSSGPQAKRKYRRPRSSGRSSGPSDSILERFSFNKGRFSSPEFGAEENVMHSPRYYLATSKAGTLVVQKDSFSRYRRRCKPKHSSSENILSNESPRQMGPNCQNGENCMARDSFEFRQRKNYHMRRHKSDANVSLTKDLSSSEDDDFLRARHKTKTICKPRNKDEFTVSPDNGVSCPYELPTAR